jgi:hypothetical protein
MNVRTIVVGLSLALASACSDLPPPPVGQLRLGLSSGVGEEQYRLGRASFAIRGAVELTLESEDDPSGDALQRALPEGDYAVQLLDGWQLERIAPSGSELVSAELASDNPLPFSIRSGELTTVVFQFRTLGQDDLGGGGDGQGDVRIAIEVDGTASPHVLISELMKNPEAVPDADGEWIELYNAGTQSVDLGGCTLARGEQSLTIEGSLPLAAGVYLTLANGESPGFSPDVVYSGLTLPNTDAFTLQLVCGTQVLDEVGVDPTLPSQRAGRSLSLSPDALDSVSNDEPANYCEGTESFGGDYGTPGAANPICAS